MGMSNGLRRAAWRWSRQHYSLGKAGAIAQLEPHFRPMKHPSNYPQVMPSRKLGFDLSRLLLLFALLAVGVTLRADEMPPNATAELAKKSENPLARVYNFGLFGNFNYQKGADERTQSAYTFAATLPFDLPANWNLFVSAKLPLIDQPVGPVDRTFGLGDLTLTALVAPPPVSGWTFGFGPSIVAPTATDPTLGQGKWEFGPAFATVYTQRTWVAGVVLSQNWSVVGADARAGVSRLTVAPFITYYINKGWYLISAPILSADWYQDPPRMWTVPLGGGFGHVVRKGKHAFNFTAHAYVNAVRPDGAAKWQFRLTTSWVFPRK
jgi:hypothetical protein